MEHVLEPESLGKYRYADSFINSISPLLWWKSLPSMSDESKKIVEGYMTAIASSASVERVFSSFGLVHSKLRNRLGVAKAGKLVFIYKYLN